MKIAYLALLVLMTSALSCAGTGASPFAGTSWTLLMMGESDDLLPVDLDPPVTLEFLGDAETSTRTIDGEGVKMGGQTGCNAYYGAYEVKGDSFRTVDVLITERGCPSMALFEREREYIDSLAHARTAMIVSHDPPVLVILTEDKWFLIFGQ